MYPTGRRRGNSLQQPLQMRARALATGLRGGAQKG